MTKQQGCLTMLSLTRVSPNCNFPHICLMPNCNGDYCPKSSNWLFMFDYLLKFWSTIVMWHIKIILESGTTFFRWIDWFSSCVRGSLEFQTRHFFKYTWLSCKHICMHGSLDWVTTHVYILCGIGRVNPYAAGE